MCKLLCKFGNDYIGCNNLTGEKGSLVIDGLGDVAGAGGHVLDPRLGHTNIFINPSKGFPTMAFRIVS